MRPPLPKSHSPLHLEASTAALESGAPPSLRFSPLGSQTCQMLEMSRSLSHDCVALSLRRPSRNGRSLHSLVRGHLGPKAALLETQIVLHPSRSPDEFLSLLARRPQPAIPPTVPRSPSKEPSTKSQPLRAALLHTHSHLILQDAVPRPWALAWPSIISLNPP